MLANRKIIGSVILALLLGASSLHAAPLDTGKEGEAGQQVTPAPRGGLRGLRARFASLFSSGKSKKATKKEALSSDLEAKKLQVAPALISPGKGLDASHSRFSSTSSKISNKEKANEVKVSSSLQVSDKTLEEVEMMAGQHLESKPRRPDTQPRTRKMTAYSPKRADFFDSARRARSNKPAIDKGIA
jgi:hypothetical protein